MSKLSLIAALSRNRIIGRDNRLPWSLPDDHAYFRKVTAGHTFLMGKNSYLSEDQLLSERLNIILSTKQDFELCGNCRGARSLKEALEMIPAGETETFVLGGEGLFEEALPRADKLYLTRVEAEVEGDACFPEVDWTEWEETSSRFHPADDDHNYAFYFKQYRRKQPD